MCCYYPPKNFSSHKLILKEISLRNFLLFYTLQILLENLGITPIPALAKSIIFVTPTTVTIPQLEPTARGVSSKKQQPLTRPTETYLYTTTTANYQSDDIQHIRKISCPKWAVPEPPDEPSSHQRIQI